MKDETQILKAAKLRTYFLDSNPDGEIGYVLSGFMTDMTISFPRGRRRNFPISLDLHSSLSSLRSDIGVSTSELAALCMMHTLAEADSTIVDHGKEMTATVNSFLARLEIRTKGIKACIEAFEL
jgi:hypothetical protein